MASVRSELKAPSDYLEPKVVSPVASETAAPKAVTPTPVVETMPPQVDESRHASFSPVQSLQQQMKVQLDLQTQQMQTMLTDQMARIATILSKKPSTE